MSAEPEKVAAVPSPPEIDRRAWYRQLNGKHWFILIVCTLGWALDTLNQQLFALARSPAVAELMKVSEWDSSVSKVAGWATAFMLIGWATGGIIFGICGDKFGRVRVMFWMVLLYSAATAVTCLVKDVNQFLALRFVSGLGFGGAFAVCATVVAESMPGGARPYALAFLQAMSSFGNISAAVIALSLGELLKAGLMPGEWTMWRWAFLVGLFPLLLLIFIRFMDEPETWKKAHAEEKRGGRKVGSIVELFGDPKIRYRVILGMIFATIGIIGFWGIMLFAIDLNRSVFRKTFERDNRAAFSRTEQAFLAKMLTDQDFARAVADEKISTSFFMSSKGSVPVTGGEIDLALSGSKIFGLAKSLADGGREVTEENLIPELEKAAGGAESAKTVTDWIRDGKGSGLNGDAIIQTLTDQKKALDTVTGRWGALTSALINLGAFFGMYSFSLITSRFGRRPTFVFFLIAAMFTSLTVFMFAKTTWQVLVFNPLMGFAVASLLSGYTIYFPELFPTRLRSTSVSFCYNAGRYISAIGPALFGFLTASIYTEAKGFEEPMRCAGATLCPIFLLGVILIWFLPETKDQPLPE